MSSDFPSDLKAEIGHVLFVDIVGYSKLLINEQSELLEHLNAMVRGSEQVRAADAQGKLIRLATGDGMALVFRNDPEAPVKCALELSRADKEHPELQLRMGIHSGPINEVIDVNEHANVTGAGINLAQRVMDCGDAGHILLSKRVADDLAQYRHWQPYLHQLGECVVKHGVRLEVVNLYTDELGNPELPAKFKPTEPAAFPVAKTSARKYLLPAGAIAIALMGLLIFSLSHKSGLSTSTGDQGPVASTIKPHAIRSIAVLPLDNYSGDPAQDYFAEGMTDELTTDLAIISQLRVISRGSTMQFKGAQRPPTPDIAKALNVDAVVEGSVLRVGDKVRITAQLIDARADKHLWAKSFERNSRDVLALQDELASAIAREINVQLTPAELSRLTRAPVVDPAAHDAYLKGWYYFNRPSDENLVKAIARFEEASTLDPSFAPAFSGLSDAYLWAGFNDGVLTASEAKPKAKAAAEKAVQLDDASAEAHTSLAGYKAWYEYDWTGSESEFRKAFALNPNYAFAHDQFGIVLAYQGRLDEAIAEGKRAAELDPLSPEIPLDATVALTWQGKYQAAKEQVKRAADLDPTFFFAPWSDGWIDIQKGDVNAAVAKLQKAKALEGPPYVTAWLGYAYGASGDRTQAMAAIEELKARSLRGYVPPFNLAIVYLGLGDHAHALEYLERAYATDSQWMLYLKGDRIFDPLRAEPRFVALIKKMRFDQ